MLTAIHRCTISRWATRWCSYWGLCWLFESRHLLLLATLAHLLHVKAGSLNIIGKWLANITIYNDQVSHLLITVWMMPIYSDRVAINLVYCLLNSDQVVHVVELWVVLQVVHDMLVQHLVTLRHFLLIYLGVSSTHWSHNALFVVFTSTTEEA
jgi:hypothetical protein